ncbi:rod shape-determining protein MreC [Luteimonas sp. M1R5S18]|uniref:Cell shape-determining protein MreC n=1 Tax=Luteimonas rhizosphaericola TaxID=3042024 RepID=A0ABT6JIF7_9GAMM|nr:rod shape-determining protein MreC [Luteimonas rhizosphaericola]MDH5830471.1 rod shape-determining protein MreC [Luteimonas rhizosphaericola]
MSSFANPAAPRPGDVAGTLRLLAFLALSVVLMVLDHRGGWLGRARDTASIAVQPLWQVAGLPARLGQTMREDAVTRSVLADDNRRLRNELLVMGARQARLQVEADENARLRGLLGAAARGGLDVQLAPILDVDLDPARQRLLLNAGARDGVRRGQSVIDAGGLLGQIIAVTPGTATVLLLTDLDHAVPVSISRTGVRLVAYGIGRADRLELRNIPTSSDVEVGDVVVTSGLGGRFPPGFPVGRIVALRPDDSHAFLIGELAPSAQLDRGRDVLLLREQPRAPLPGAAVPASAAAVPAVTEDEAAPGGESVDAVAPASEAARTDGSTAPGATPPSPRPQPQPERTP